MSSLREREKAFKKRVIAETANSLLSDKPYESVTVDEIARSVGCGKGTLYQHFESKEHILSYLVANSLEQVCDDMEKQCVKNSDFLSALHNYIVLQFNFFLEHNQIFSSWLRRSLDNDISAEWIDEIQQNLNRKVEMLEEILKRGIDEGLIIPVDSLELATLIEKIVRDCTFAPVEDRLSDPNRALDLLKIILFNGIMLKKVDLMDGENGKT